MADPMPSPVPSRGRTIALVVSLGLNVLLITLIVVVLSRAAGGGLVVGQPGGQLAPGVIARGLSPESQQRIRDRAGGTSRCHDAKPAATRARRGWRPSAPSLRRDYSPAAFAQSLERVRAADSVLEEEAILMLRDIINGLTPDERKTVDRPRPHRRQPPALVAAPDQPRRGSR